MGFFAEFGEQDASNTLALVQAFAVFPQVAQACRLDNGCPVWHGSLCPGLTGWLLPRTVRRSLFTASTYLTAPGDPQSPTEDMGVLP